MCKVESGVDGIDYGYSDRIVEAEDVFGKRIGDDVFEERRVDVDETGVPVSSREKREFMDHNSGYDGSGSEPVPVVVLEDYNTQL